MAALTQKWPLRSWRRAALLGVGLGALFWFANIVIYLLFHVIAGDSRTIADSRVDLLSGLIVFALLGIYVEFGVYRRHSTDERLRQLSRAVEQSPSTVMITNLAGEIEYVNPKFTALTGYTLDEVRGRNPNILKSGETASDEYARMWSAINAGAERRGEFHNVKKNGDLYWEYTCLPGLAKMGQQLAQYGGLDVFIRDIPTIRPKGGTFWELVMTVCWAAAFGSNPDAPHGFDLPIDPDTGALNAVVWARWLAHDPLRKLDDPACADALRGMRLAFIDVGSYDEYQLQVGARLLHRKLDALNIAHEYQEYPDGHRGTHYRYETSLPLLAEALR